MTHEPSRSARPSPSTAGAGEAVCACAPGAPRRHRRGRPREGRGRESGGRGEVLARRKRSRRAFSVRTRGGERPACSECSERSAAWRPSVAPAPAPARARPRRAS